MRVENTLQILSLSLSDLRALAQLESCRPETCILITCSLGPLERYESVLFKVRSRLFTESLVKVC